VGREGDKEVPYKTSLISTDDHLSTTHRFEKDEPESFAAASNSRLILGIISVLTFSPPRSIDKK
jgi:hypothetical protein